jgi:hypothetical protein
MKSSEDIKNEIKQALADTDWTQLPDVKLDNKAEFINYRFQLRSYLTYAPSYLSVPPAPEPVWTQTEITEGTQTG